MEPLIQLRRLGVLVVAWLAIGCDAQDFPLIPRHDASASGGSSSGGSSNGGSGFTSSGGSSMGGSGGIASNTAGASGTGNPINDGSPSDGTAIDAGSDGPIVYAEASTCAGYALDFDGSTAYASVTRFVQDDFTLEAWIKTTTSLTGLSFFNGNGLIYADIAGVNNDFGAAILNDKFAFGVGGAPPAADAGPEAGLQDLTLQSTTSVTTGQWIHVAATRNKTTGEIQVLVNGVLEGSLIVANNSSLDAQMTLTLGANAIDSRFFAGTMDEVRIWNVVRAPADILANMHHRLQGNEAGLAAYWRFDTPGAATAVDTSPNMHDATLTVPPNWVVSDAPICQ